MIIVLEVDNESVTEVLDPMADWHTKPVRRTIDAYRTPDGIIRLWVISRGPINWPRVDYAAVQAGIAAGYRGWEIKRI